MASLAFHHMAIACNDPLAVERFYTKYFGFTRARVLPVEDTQIVFIKSGDAYLELFKAKEPLPQPRAKGDGPWYPEWRHIAFKVDDVDAKLAEMGERRGRHRGAVQLRRLHPRVAHRLGRGPGGQHRRDQPGIHGRQHGCSRLPV